MSEAYERVREALHEALAVARGEDTGAIFHRVEIPEVNVAAQADLFGHRDLHYGRRIHTASGPSTMKPARVATASDASLRQTAVRYGQSCCSRASIRTASPRRRAPSATNQVTFGMPAMVRT